MTEKTTAEAAVQNVRPLNSTQTRNLEKLVNGDYDQLAAEIKSFAADQKRLKTEEIKADHEHLVGPRLVSKIRKAKRKYQRALDEILDEARRSGIQLMNVPSPSSSLPSYSDTSLEKKISDAVAEIDAEKVRALLTLEAQRGKSLRMVYQASISSQAEDILANIPTAQTLMVQAAQDKETPKEIK